MKEDQCDQNSISLGTNEFARLIKVETSTRRKIFHRRRRPFPSLTLNFLFYLDPSPDYLASLTNDEAAALIGPRSFVRGGERGRVVCVVHSFDTVGDPRIAEKFIRPEPFIPSISLSYFFAQPPHKTFNISFILLALRPSPLSLSLSISPVSF